MRTLLIITLAVAFPFITKTQESKLNTEEQEVFSVIEELFEAYKAGDSTRVRATFAENAVMMRASYKEGKSIATKGSVDSFVKYVGGGLEKLHNELLWDYSVNIDDNLANIWTKYAFFLDGQFHHCGSETFTLYRSEMGWKIIFLADNNMEDECDIPQRIMNLGTKK